MAWQQQPGGYDNYGGYVDTSYAQNDQQNQQYYGGPANGMVSDSCIQKTSYANTYKKYLFDFIHTAINQLPLNFSRMLRSKQVQPIKLLTICFPREMKV